MNTLSWRYTICLVVKIGERTFSRRIKRGCRPRIGDLYVLIHNEQSPFQCLHAHVCEERTDEDGAYIATFNLRETPTLTDLLENASHWQRLE